MRRTLLIGLACCLSASVVFIVSQLLALPAQDVLVAVAGGTVLASVGQASPIQRYVSFLIGMVSGLVYFAALAALVPGTWMGGLVATCAAILLCTLISAATKGRLPLWAMLLGMVLFAATYKPLFSLELWMFESQSIMIACWLLFAVTCGYLVVIAVELTKPRLAAPQVAVAEPEPMPEAAKAAVS